MYNMSGHGIWSQIFIVGGIGNERYIDVKWQWAVVTPQV